MKKTTLTSLFLFVSSFFFLLVLIPSPAPAENNEEPITVMLTADPELYRDTCPAMIKFQGEISAKNLKPGTVVEYRFIRSDGVSSPVRKTIFAKGQGTVEVATTWTLESPDLVNYEGWEKIRIVKPIKIESPKAFFKVNCKTSR